MATGITRNIRWIRTYLFAGVILPIATLGCVSMFRSKPPPAVLAYQLGINFYDKKLYKDAVEHFEKVLAEHGDRPIAQTTTFFLANCYRELGDRERALGLYQKLVDTYKSGYWANRARKTIREMQVEVQEKEKPSEEAGTAEGKANP